MDDPKGMIFPHQFEAHKILENTALSFWTVLCEKLGN
jgi:hypothetical protein